MDYRPGLRRLSITLLPLMLLSYPPLAALAFAAFLLSSKKERPWLLAFPSTVLVLCLSIGTLLQGLTLTTVSLVLSILVFWFFLYGWTTRVRADDYQALASGMAVGTLLVALKAVADVVLLDFPRAVGFSFHANLLGSLMVITSLFLLGNSLKVQQFRIVHLGAAAGIFTILLSGSRGAFIALMLGLLCYGLLALYQKQHLKPGMLFITFLASLALFMVLIYSPLHQRLNTLDSAFADQGRVSLWELGLELAAQKPLFGWGVRAWQREIQVLEPSIDLVILPNTHNLYLEILLDSGTLGLTGFIWWLLVVFALLRKAAVADRLTAATAAICLLAFLSHNLWDVLWYHGFLTALVWLPIGLALTRVQAVTPVPHDAARDPS